MKDRGLLFILIASGIAASAELGVIITSVSPYAAGSDVFWTFFICLFLSTTTLFTLIWHLIKKKIHAEFGSVSLWVSLRQIALITIVFVLSLFFRSLNILSIWDIIPLAISAILIEFFFQADKSNPLHESS